MSCSSGVLRADAGNPAATSGTNRVPYTTSVVRRSNESLTASAREGLASISARSKLKPLHPPCLATTAETVSSTRLTITCGDQRLAHRSCPTRAPTAAAMAWLMRPIILFGDVM